MAFSFYRQIDSMDCGPTCLQMVARHYGKSFPLQFLREKSQIGIEGVNLLGISEAAESIGFRTRSVKLDFTTLIREVNFPAILHWNQNHFVVLYKVKKNKLYIADPAKGLIEYTSGEFKQSWLSNRENGEEEGIALLLEPTPMFLQFDTEENERNPKLSFSRITQYFIPYKRFLLQIVIGIGITSVLQLIFPFLIQSVVDVGIKTANIHFIYIVLFAQVALFSGRLIVEFVRNWIILHISSRVNIAILTDFLVKLMRLPISFFDSKRAGDIMQRMGDHKRIESFLTGSSLSLLLSLLNLLIFSVILAFFNTSIFIIFIASSIIYSLWVILFLSKRKSIDYKKFDISAKEQNATIQLIQGMQEIKLHNMQQPIRWNWERIQIQLFKLNMRGLAINQWQQSGAFFINEGKNILITFLSAKAVIDGQITLGTMLSIQYIIGQLNSPIEQMIGFIQSWQNARISLERLNEIHGLEDEEPVTSNLLKSIPIQFTRRLIGGRKTETLDYVDLSQSDSFDTVSKSVIAEPLRDQEVATPVIQFRDVSFVYPGAGNQAVLRNINFSIPVGKTTAIVGPSGGGKTTILKLLLKFYEPQKGEIRLGGTSLSNISHTTWRKHCGVVMQESYIFSDTIAKNIAVGEETINMARLNKAIDIANIRDFLESLPLGFNTKIGVEGSGISMGQRQRILIARAVYRNPAFLLLDEATNSLDANNESLITHQLDTFVEDKTVLIIAHRLSTIKKADQILVLENGEISERGTHDQLLALKGSYYTLVKNQLETGS